MKFDKEELEILNDFIGYFNYYEMMGILCKIYPERDIESYRKILIKAFCKIKNELKKAPETV
jgi:hypothetical protein